MAFVSLYRLKNMLGLVIVDEVAFKIVAISKKSV